jgi:site-specific DNA-adenine methylase
MDIKGPFSYSGNKFRIWNKHLKEFFSSYDFIYEPFAGSAVCLYNSNKGGIASDVDRNVVALHNSLKDNSIQLSDPSIISNNEFMELDSNTIKNLELIENQNIQEKGHSLFSILNKFFSRPRPEAK